MIVSMLVFTALVQHAEPAPTSVDDKPSTEAKPGTEAKPDEPAKPYYDSKPKPDAKPKQDPGILLPLGQTCVGTACAWLPLPLVTSAIAGYVVTYVGNDFGVKDDAAFGPMLAGMITDVAVVAVIAAGYGAIFLGLKSGNEAAALGGLLGGITLVAGAFFVRPFAVGIATTTAWSLGATPRPDGKEPQVPPQFFADDKKTASE
jgi:hypothetical protein